MKLKFRRIPGYYNKGYWFDVVGDDGVPHLGGEVRKLGDSTWNRSASWRATSKNGDKTAHHTTREGAVRELLRRLVTAS